MLESECLRRAKQERAQRVTGSWPKESRAEREPGLLGATAFAFPCRGGAIPTPFCVHAVAPL